MPAGRKIAFAVATLVAGMSLALVFRKPDADADAAANGKRPEAHVTRRLATTDELPPMPFRLAPHPDTGYRPPPAATGSGPVEIAPAPNSYDSIASPIGALLQPLNSEPSPTSLATLALGADSHSPSKPEEAEQAVQSHRVVDGDTLSKLAAEYLGSGERYLEIFECNRDLLKNPDLLPVGKTLKIPPRVAPPPAASAPGRVAPGSIGPPAGGAAESTIAPVDGWRPAK